MSDVNIDFTVANIDANFTVATNELSFTPTDLQLNFYTGGYVETATGLNANISNVHISGGTNGYVLQTDGTGNLSWTAQTGGGGGNGSPGGSNTQIQFNNAGSFGGNAGFTFNKVTGDVVMPGNLTVPGTINGTISNANSALFSNYANTAGVATLAGTVTDNAQPNITSVGTLVTLTVSGNISTTGTTSIQQAKEKFVPNSTAATGTVNFDILTQAILLNTANATANFTLNIRGNSTVTLDTVMSSNQSMTCTFINPNGTTGYYANVIKIDGTTVTPQWVYPGAPTTGTVSGKDVYTFNILKTASNTYTVLASKTGFV